jgi:hypothetical protein
LRASITNRIASSTAAARPVGHGCRLRLLRRGGSDYTDLELMLAARGQITFKERRMQRGVTATLLCLLWLALWPGSKGTLALEIEVETRAVKREILALYDSRHEPAPHETRIHRFAEMPLNWLGFTIVYHDVNGALPSPSTATRYRGVLTWLLEPLAEPETIGRFLAAVANAGLRYVALGDLVPGLDLADPALIGRLYARLGLQHTGEYVDVTYRSRIVSRDERMVGFERPLDRVLPDFPVHDALPGPHTVHLRAEVPGRDGVRRSALVVTGPGGGFAAQGFTVFFEPSTDRMMWVLNPFLFFRLAFGADRFPIPDVTTMSGRRLYFSHIDGDGWNNVSEVEGYREAQVLSSEVIAREAIEPFADLPVSVALISGDVMPLLGGNPAGARVARRLFALPQVEVASHTHTHPFNWGFFESYDRGDEERRIEAYQRPERPLLERINGTLAELAGRQRPADQFDKYVAGSDDMPRTYMRQPFDVELEVAGAVRIAESLAPPGKRAMLYQWSGDTTPFPEAIRATRRAGLRNMNGGDSRLDREFPSVSYVPPIGRPAGGERQIYAGNSNENTYTNDWTGPYYGFYLLEQTLTNTESPRRLKPFNLYYHMYSGEKPAALAAIRHFLSLARRSPVVPVPASHYAAIADDFDGVELLEVGFNSWSVSRRGEVQTVRFDDAEALDVDLAASTGVIGASRANGALYVTLDPAEPHAQVALAPVDVDAAVPASERRAMLVGARWRLSQVERSGCGVSFAATGFGSSQMVWRMAPSRRLAVTVARAGESLFAGVAASGADGLAEIDLPVDARNPVEVRIGCDD